MNEIMKVILMFSLIPTLDRLGGADNYKKHFRRYGIPALIGILYPTFEMLFLMPALAGVLSLDFDAIENKNWGAVWTKGLAIAFCVYPLCGPYGLLVSASWLFFIWWSNNEIKLQPIADYVTKKTGKTHSYVIRKINWKWAEIFRLTSIPIAVLFNIKG